MPGMSAPVYVSPQGVYPEVRTEQMEGKPESPFIGMRPKNITVDVDSRFSTR